MEHKRASDRGFTLIELLIVVAIIGLLAAIAVPNLLAAMQKTKQKRTMADMRNIAATWEVRHVDANSYLAAGAGFDAFPPNAVTYDDLVAHLTPTYVRAVPKVDGWRRDFEFHADESTYAIRSFGKDGLPDGDTYSKTTTQNFACDIVYANGSFAVYPEGIQSGT